jgi:long-chain acyl-CoA synthetase
MDKVSDTATTELEKFWEALIPMHHGEKPCLYRHGHREGVLMSYKDLYAHGHCAAAYLMVQGLNQGDPVVILSGHTADYLILDIALQYLGAINITLPSDVPTDTLFRICERYEARFVFMPDAQTLLHHQELTAIKPQLAAILVGNDDLEGLESSKLIAFDRLVAIGKTAWRESAGHLRSRKQAVRPSDLYALIVPEEGPEGDFEPMSFMALMENIQDAYQAFTKVQAKALISILPPFRVLHRSYGTYGAMKARTPIWLYPMESLKQEFFASVQPTAFASDPVHIKLLYDLLPMLIGKDLNAAKAAAKAIQKAHDVISKKTEAESQGKPNPFLNRLRYRFRNRKIYAKTRLALGGHLQLIVCDGDGLDQDAAVFLTECGITITAPKPFL